MIIKLFVDNCSDGFPKSLVPLFVDNFPKEVIGFHMFPHRMLVYLRVQQKPWLWTSPALLLLLSDKAPCLAKCWEQNIHGVFRRLKKWKRMKETACNLSKKMFIFKDIKLKISN